MADSAPVTIVFALYPGVTHLDFTGPHQVFSRLPGAEVLAASAAGGEIEADGLVFARLPRLSDIARSDVLCVPGGLGCIAAMQDEGFMREIRRLAEGARYVTSVCTGSLILGAAGLLRGRRATTHWAWRELLVPFGAIVTEGRVVRDGNLLTGGGVTAGIDFALVLARELVGDEGAQAIQLTLEYAPAPPFDSGHPDVAPAAVVQRVTRAMTSLGAERRAAVERVAAELAAT